MQTWYNAFCLLIFSGQFNEKCVPVKERNIKLLLETVRYIASTEAVTCIITIEIVMYIMHCRLSKIATHRFAAEISPA